jgi:hypothetical protein
MTKSEFAKGWKLLILQPWGWRYRGLDEQGRPTAESKAQMEFYYAKLQWATPEAWQHVVETIFAQGEEWPSVKAINQSLLHLNARFVKALPAPTAEMVPMPEEVRNAIDRLTNGSTMDKGNA